MSKAPHEVAEAICEICRRKTTLSLDRMFVLAMLAGVYIGFGAQLATTVTQDLAPKVGVGFSNLVGGAVFSVGLMLVVIGGAELFTGNSLIMLSCCSRRVAPKGLVKNWVVVYLGNFVGSILLVSIEQ